MTDAEHRLQHQKGETAINPKFWWEEMAELYRQQWAVSRLRRQLKLTGKQSTDMELIHAWMDEKDLTKYYYAVMGVPDRVRAP